MLGQGRIHCGCIVGTGDIAGRTELAGHPQGSRCHRIGCSSGMACWCPVEEAKWHTHVDCHLYRLCG